MGIGLRLNNQEYLLSSIQNYWNLFLKNWVFTFKLKTLIFLTFCLKFWPIIEKSARHSQFCIDEFFFCKYFLYRRYEKYKYASRPTAWEVNFYSEQNGMNPRLVLNITIARLKIGIFIKLILSLAYVVGGVWVNSVFVFRLMQLNVFVVPKMWDESSRLISVCIETIVLMMSKHGFAPRFSYHHIALLPRRTRPNSVNFHRFNRHLRSCAK